MAAKKLTFEVLGPYNVPTSPKTRMIGKEERPTFFGSNPHLRDRLGVYVFGVRSGGGVMPVYVGKTKRSYDEECFTADKCLKYTKGLSSYAKGTPVLFFVATPRKQKGPPNAKVIKDLEDFLIQTGKARNPDLLNKRGAKEANWAIRGVLRTNQVGQPPKAAGAFKGMMGFSK